MTIRSFLNAMIYQQGKGSAATCPPAPANSRRIKIRAHIRVNSHIIKMVGADPCVGPFISPTSVLSCDLLFQSLDLEYRHSDKVVQLIDRLHDVLKNSRPRVFIGKSGGLDAGLFD